MLYAADDPLVTACILALQVSIGWQIRRDRNPAPADETKFACRLDGSLVIVLAVHLAFGTSKIVAVS